MTRSDDQRPQLQAELEEPPDQQEVPAALHAVHGRPVDGADGRPRHLGHEGRERDDEVSMASVRGDAVPEDPGDDRGRCAEPAPTSPTRRPQPVPTNLRRRPRRAPAGDGSAAGSAAAADDDADDARAREDRRQIDDADDDARCRRPEVLPPDLGAKVVAHWTCELRSTRRLEAPRARPAAHPVGADRAPACCSCSASRSTASR